MRCPCSWLVRPSVAGYRGMLAVPGMPSDTDTAESDLETELQITKGRTPRCTCIWNPYRVGQSSAPPVFFFFGIPVFFLGGSEIFWKCFGIPVVISEGNLGEALSPKPMLYTICFYKKGIGTKLLSLCRNILHCRSRVESIRVI